MQAEIAPSSMGKETTNDARIVISSLCAEFSDVMPSAFNGP